MTDRPDVQKPDEHRPDDVPEILREGMENPDDPTEIGGANAEATGAWRILRNSVILAVIAMVVIAVVYSFMSP